ncbi:MAG TPA: sigma-70 family RNA polymerase sigma factor [Opitutaceae bacterium]|nr:sigma-70 family RNA polymerase sigma factor [Opitutaceae bacterium]
MTSSPSNDTSAPADGAQPNAEETALVRAAQNGDHRAFEGLIRLHTSRIYNYIFQMTRHRQDAEDLCQQTFLKAYNALERFDPQRPLICWLLTIARRTALNHFRAAKSFTEIPFDAASSETSPDRETERQDNLETLWDRARRILSPRDFEVLWLRISEDMDLDDIAEATQLTTTHVKVIVHRARQQLMKSLKP